MGKKYYEILGVPENASDKDIRKAFLKLSKQYHPDMQNGKTDEEKAESEQKFKEINEAYQTLSDKKKKEKYDLFGDVDPNNMNMNDDGFSDLGDLIRNMFNRGASSARKSVRKGTNVVVNVHVSLKDIYNNINKTFAYKRYEPCADCDGTGFADKTAHACHHCNGTGTITETKRQGYNSVSFTSTCPYCKGTGKDTSAEKCPTCGGKGCVLTDANVSVVVDLNWLMGRPLVLGGHGNIPDRESVPGDLIINPVLDEVDGFSVDSNLNVIKTIEVPIVDCILGTTLKVNGLDEKTISIKIKESTGDGEYYRIPNKGLKVNGSSSDMYVVIKHKMPKNLSKEEKETLEKLRKNDNFK